LINFGPASIRGIVEVVVEVVVVVVVVEDAIVVVVVVVVVIVEVVVVTSLLSHRPLSFKSRQQSSAAKIYGLLQTKLSSFCRQQHNKHNTNKQATHRLIAFIKIFQ
jgi:hypothetical protein